MAQGYIRGIGSYFSQIWHSSDHDQVPFYPLWYNQFLNRKLPVLIDTNNLMLVYASVPILRTVIDKKAEMLMNAKIQLFKVAADGTETEVLKHPVLDLLKKPNCLQSGKDFLWQWSIMRDVYATVFIYKNKPSSISMPKICWVLPSGEMKINPTGLLFEQTDVSEVIKNYEHINNQFPNAAPRYFDPKEIMRYVDGAADRYFFGISKIITNKLLISNLQQALQTRNVLLADMGAKGILSGAGSDASGGAIPLGDEERKRIEKTYREGYGVGEEQSKVIVTNTPLKFTPMAFPTKDLMTFEEVDACLGGICDMFGMQRQIFADSSATKPSPIGGDGKGKIEEAMKITYQTTLTQAIKEFLEGFNTDPDYQLEKQNLVLRGTFEDVPVMQEDQVDAEMVKSQQVTSASTQTTSVIALNAAVKAGQMELEAAIAILVNVHCMEEDIASQLILKPKEVVDPNAITEENLSDEQKEYLKALKFKLKIA